MPPQMLTGLGVSCFSRALQYCGQHDLPELVSSLEMLLLEAEDKERILKYRDIDAKERFGSSQNEMLTHHIMDKNAPWLLYRPEPIDIPGMLAQEDIQYYHYISRYYTGQGEVVELGPWLGLSTHHLMVSLSDNPAFHGRSIHVFDDFIWRSGWMDQYVKEEDRVLGNHQDFSAMFNKYASRIAGKLRIYKAKVAHCDGNEHVPVAEWDGKPIELIVVDCGRTLAANQGWYDIFSPAFIPGKTLVVMQDWRLHRERPRKSYNQTLLFTEANPRLHLVHEVTDGGVAAFIFR